MLVCNYFSSVYVLPDVLVIIEVGVCSKSKTENVFNKMIMKLY
jgi:hypothetical protein